MTAPTLESYAVTGRKAVAQWAQLRFQPQLRTPGHPPPPPPPPLRPAPEGAFSHEQRARVHEQAPTQDATEVTAMPGTGTAAATAAAAAAVGNGGAGGEDWWCVKAAGGNGGMDIWVLHEGNWNLITEALSDHESYVIQVRTGLGGRLGMHCCTYSAVEVGAMGQACPALVGMSVSGQRWRCVRQVVIMPVCNELFSGRTRSVWHSIYDNMLHASLPWKGHTCRSESERHVRLLAIF